MAGYTNISKVISGGQTGADRGALMGAKASGIETGGWALPGFRTENGPDPSLGTEFGLREHDVDSHSSRDQANVDECDLLVAFRYQIPKTGRGTEQTVQYALSGEYRHVELIPPSSGTYFRKGKKSVSCSGISAIMIRP